jgi:hypothetical protein
MEKIDFNNGYVLKIMQDEDPTSCLEWDRVGRMYFLHGRYNLGDKHNLSIDEIQELVNNKNSISLPVYMYDHSGITISTGSFSCKFDSGQLGFIIADWQEAKKMGFKFKKKVIEALEHEIKEYDTYIRGEVYGFSLVKVTECNHCGSNTEEEIHSCWGFYGSDHEKSGLLDDARPYLPKAVSN